MNAKLSRREASQYLREKHGIQAKPATLAKYASVGGGPRFRRAGRFPVYETADLDAWAAGKLTRVVSSTGELDALDHR